MINLIDSVNSLCDIYHMKAHREIEDDLVDVSLFLHMVNLYTISAMVYCLLFSQERGCKSNLRNGDNLHRLINFNFVNSFLGILVMRV